MHSTRQESRQQQQQQQQQQQERARFSRRSTMFTLRSRSNTSSSSLRSPSSLSILDMAEEDASSSHSSIRFGRNSCPNQLSEPTSRRSLFRGRVGKVLMETMISTIGSTDHRDAEPGEDGSSSEMQDWKHRISRPFDFRHVSHADRHHLTALEAISGDELIAGRDKAQAPRQARDAAYTNLSSEDLAPDRTYAERPVAALRSARSVESFSQLKNSVYNHGRSWSVAGVRRPCSPFPLVSLRYGPESSGREDGSNAVPTSRSRRESSVWSAPATASSMMAEPSWLGLLESPWHSEHALTTADDSAVYTVSPPFNPSLEDVAEEPEKFVKPRPAPLPPSRIAFTPTLSAFGPSLAKSPSSPKPRSRSRGSIHISPRSFAAKNPVSQPISPISPVPEPLGSTSLVRRPSVRRPNTNHRRRSNTWRAIEASWEDDVDFIYENALEAECDLEWDRRLPAAHANTCLPTAHKTAAKDVYSVTTLLPQVYESAHEAIFEDWTGECGDSDPHFSALNARQSATNSTCSSHMHFSGRSSYDSSLVSSAQSSSLWGPSIPRSASPAGSLPDLIPSQRMRKEASFGAAQEGDDTSRIVSPERSRQESMTFSFDHTGKVLNDFL